MKYLGLAEGFIIAEAVTGIPARVLASISRKDLLDSALHVDVDDAVQTMLAVASGEIDEKSLTSWLNMRVNFTPKRGS